MKYDYFVAGRWRNQIAIRKVVEELRQAGKTVYSFLESEYDADGIKFENNPNVDAEATMVAMEQLEDWQTNPTFREIFETDMQAERESEAFILVFPAGLSAHMELGAAYGMGKKCYGLGQPEKVETLYCMFDKIFDNVEALIEYTAKEKV